MKFDFQNTRNIHPFIELYSQDLLIFIFSSEYDHLSSTIDQLDSYLDALEQKNDDLYTKLQDLLESSRQTRHELEGQREDQAVEQESTVKEGNQEEAGLEDTGEQIEGPSKTEENKDMHESYKPR